MKLAVGGTSAATRRSCDWSNLIGVAGGDAVYAAVAGTADGRHLAQAPVLPSSHGLGCRLGAAREGASMRIWVIGSDPVARALGRSWAQAGHEVLFTFSFDGTDFDALAAGTGGRHGTLAEGPAAEVVLLAAPGPR